MTSKFAAADDVLNVAVRTAIRRAGANHGGQITLGGPSDPYRDGALHVNLLVFDMGSTRFVSVSRHKVHDEGSEGTSYTFVARAGPLPPKEEKRLDEFVAEGMRVRRREAAIGRDALTGVAPSWSYVMHRVARLLLAHAAEGRDLTFTPISGNVVRPDRGKGKREKLSTYRAMRVGPAHFMGRYGRQVAISRADRILVHDLEIGSGAGDTPLAVFKDRAAPELVVTGLQLPDTVLLTCQGVDLARIVDHPAFGEHAGVPVLRAVNDVTTGGVILHLPLILDPAGIAPDGVDTSWRNG